MADKKLQLGVLISGNGTNLQVLIDRIDEGNLDAVIKVVISNKKDAYGLERAKKAGILAVFLDPHGFSTEAEYNKKILEILRENNVELVVMAGYMKILGDEVLDGYKNAVINLHPSLLPDFKGAHAIERTFESGTKVGGVTVHFASSELDGGPVIAQTAVAIEGDDTVETYEEKLHQEEYKLLPSVVQMIAEGRVKVVGSKVEISNFPL